MHAAVLLRRDGPCNEGGPINMHARRANVLRGNFGGIKLVAELARSSPQW